MQFRGLYIYIYTLYNLIYSACGLTSSIMRAYKVQTATLTHSRIYKTTNLDDMFCAKCTCRLVTLLTRRSPEVVRILIESKTINSNDQSINYGNRDHRRRNGLQSICQLAITNEKRFFGYWPRKRRQYCLQHRRYVLSVMNRCTQLDEHLHEHVS